MSIYEAVEAAFFLLHLATKPKHALRLSNWDTKEEAFAEYKDKVPEHVYKKLLMVEVKPY